MYQQLIVISAPYFMKYAGAMYFIKKPIGAKWNKMLDTT